MQKHHIDTSAIIEPENTEDGKFCNRYFNKLKTSYNGVFSLPVLGELMLTLLQTQEYNDRTDFQEFLFHLIRVHRIEFYVPKDIRWVIERMKKVDTRIDPVDMEILACAIEDEANSLVTLDTKLIGNLKIEKEFNIQILHPKSLF